MKVLVIGSGAREHALVAALGRDPHVTDVAVAPGNPGMCESAGCHILPGGVTDPDGVVALATKLASDLVVIGPEAPLVVGVADALRAAGIPVFGPSKEAAALEGSKAFAKDVMTAAGIPTAQAHVCTTVDEAEAALQATGAPYVVKDDGLAGGKGVVVTDDHDRAMAHATQCMDRPGSSVVIEDFLDGPEVSLFCLTDGKTVVPLAPAQDFKRVGEGDTGPNTGGMGAYSPLPWAPASLVDDVVATVAQPAIDEMARRGTPFSGLLYVGLALTSQGPKVVEFNARFGDPETQVVLARLNTPLGGLLHACATERLAEMPPLEWSNDAAVTVVLASEGYPASPRTGDAISGVDQAEEVPGVHVLHAGTTAVEGELRSSGGRVLSVVALGDGLGEARSRAYEAMGRIELDGSHFRGDIAAAAMDGAVRVPQA